MTQDKKRIPVFTIEVHKLESYTNEELTYNSLKLSHKECFGGNVSVHGHDDVTLITCLRCYTNMIVRSRIFRTALFGASISGEQSTYDGKEPIAGEVIFIVNVVQKS